MIDMHQDLLSILYYGYVKNNYNYAEEWIQNFHKENVFGLLANLYFMSPKEMEEEMGSTEISVVDMFRISTELFRKYLPDEKVVYSIEGCDYIQDEEELETLYHMGLRNILLVWNEPNAYGSGNRGDYGLTEKGKSFLIKAIDLGIGIDMSHMNQKTFYDTIDLIREQQALGKKVKVIASHSNCRDVYDHKRNIDDQQLEALKSVGGIIGLVSYSTFVGENSEEKYLEHIEHAIGIMGVDQVGLSSDDMTFANALFGDSYEMVFPYNEIASRIRTMLKKHYTEEDVNKIMYQNIMNVYKEELK